MSATPSSLSGVQDAHPPRPPAGSPRARRAALLAAFHVGVPALVGIYASLNNWQLLTALGLAGTLLFYLGHALVPWWLTAGITRGLQTLLVRWRLRSLTLTAVGGVLAGLASIPYAVWLGGQFPAALPAVANPSVHDPLGILGWLLRAWLLWMFANWVFDRYLGLPRYRYALSEPVTTVAPPADTGFPAPIADIAFLRKLTRPASLASLLALKAEQHYLQVITDQGSELLLHRLSDAIGQLPPGAGAQVHRSWWVARRGIAGLGGQGRSLQLQLRNGLVVPVSAPYQQLARGLVDATASSTEQQIVENRTGQ